MFYITIHNLCTICMYIILVMSLNNSFSYKFWFYLSLDLFFQIPVDFHLKIYMTVYAYA